MNDLKKHLTINDGGLTKDMEEDRFGQRLEVSLFLKKGTGCGAKGDFEQSLINFDAVLAINPQNPEALYLRGLMLYSLKNPLCATRHLGIC